MQVPTLLLSVCSRGPHNHGHTHVAQTRNTCLLTYSRRTRFGAHSARSPCTLTHVSYSSLLIPTPAQTVVGASERCYSFRCLAPSRTPPSIILLRPMFLFTPTPAPTPHTPSPTVATGPHQVALGVAGFQQSHSTTVHRLCMPVRVQHVLRVTACWMLLVRGCCVLLIGSFSDMVTPSLRMTCVHCGTHLTFRM
jgi:hypothetical protein